MKMLTATVTQDPATGLAPPKQEIDMPMRERLRERARPHETLLMALAWALLPGTCYAQADCADWNGQPFFEAATASDVRRCLLHGADIGARAATHGYTPLHTAAKFGTAETVVALLTGGAAVSARARHGVTPLHLAAANGRAGTIRALLASGANVDAQDDDGMTPLHLAAMWGSAETVASLLDGGADIEAPRQ